MAKHRGKTSAHASTLLKSVLRTLCQVFRMLSKTQNGSDFDVLPFLWKCKRNNESDNLKTRNNYSLHVQEVVLCNKINQRWLSINLSYKTFFNWTIQIYFSWVHMMHIFVNNFFCVACINFALTIFKDNDLLYNFNRVQMLNFSIIFLTFLF
jgi:hypothetical protein